MTLSDMTLLQWIILLTGITSIALTQQPWWPKAERLAPFIGLASQPIWLYETYTCLLSPWLFDYVGFVEEPRRDLVQISFKAFKGFVHGLRVISVEVPWFKSLVQN